MKSALLSLFLLLAAFTEDVGGAETDPADSGKEKPKQVSGKADVLRHVKKPFAIFEGIAADGTVRLHLEGEDQPTNWPIRPDTEFKIDGWWGRPEQFVEGDRVWVWLAVDRDRLPTSVLLLADEISEMDMHCQQYTVTEAGSGEVTLAIPGEEKVADRVVKVGEAAVENNARGFVQTNRGEIRRFLAEEDLEEARASQQEWLRGRWTGEGLPGMVGFLHPLSGEMEIYLDHEGRRWGRYLRKGDEVTLVADREIRAQVKQVEPWREKTRVRLVTGSGLDQMELAPGQHISLKVPPPPAAVQALPHPTDLDHPRTTPEERIDWFLATLYCPCGIAGDRCTGMYYTLAACNVNTCGGPDDMREILAARIAKGLTDREIFGQLIRERGRDVWWPHLLR